MSFSCRDIQKNYLPEFQNFGKISIPNKRLGDKKSHTSGSSSGTLPIHDKEVIVESLLVFIVRSKCKCILTTVT